MSAPTRSLRYVTRFQCLADACEDTCCSGMHILLSEADRERVAAPQNVVPLASPVHGYRFALARDEQGTCRLLQDRLCSLQKQHGEAGLPDSCARFPRVVTARAQSIEFSGTLACPEIARLCLLSEDGMDWVSPTPDPALRTPAQGFAPTSEHPQAVQLHAQGVQILQQDAPLGERLGQLVRAVSSDEVPPVSSSGVQTLLSVLLGLKRRGLARYNQLVDAVLFTYQVAALQEEPGLGALEGAALTARIGTTYLRKKEHADSALAPWLNAMCTRFVLNDWHQQRFEPDHPPLRSVFGLVLRAALVRFLVIGHPVVNELAHQAQRLPEHRPLLERAVVQTVQVFAKFVARDQLLMDLVREDLEGAAPLSLQAQGLAQLA